MNNLHLHLTTKSFINFSIQGLALLSFGCASIVSSSKRPVTITSNPVGASITVSNSKGIVMQTGQTPLTVNLDASKGFFTRETFHVSATKPGFDNAVTTFKGSVNGWYFGNILFGGVIGLLIVDPATGAMWKLQDVYAINLTPSKKVSLNNGRSINIVALQDVPLHLRSKLERVN
jgi:hypothetical protein